MEEISALVEKLKHVEHFNRLSSMDLIAIVKLGQIRTYPMGTTIFDEGAQCAGMHVLLDGRVDLFKTGPEGQTTILNTLEPVIMFNEVPVLDGGPNPSSAITIEDSTIWSVNCERFQWLITRYPLLSLGLLNIMARRNRVLVSHYGNLSFLSVSARIAKLLLELSEEGSQKIDRAAHPIKSLAAKAVTTPEAVSRTLKMIASEGVIDVDRQKIHILDVTKLKDFAQI